MTENPEWRCFIKIEWNIIESQCKKCKKTQWPECIVQMKKDLTELLADNDKYRELQQQRNLQANNATR